MPSADVWWTPPTTGPSLPETLIAGRRNTRVNERMQQLLESEATTSSKGFVSEHDPEGIVSLILCLAPRGACAANGAVARWSDSDAVPEVPALASAEELLHLVKSRGR